MLFVLVVSLSFSLYPFKISWPENHLTVRETLLILPLSSLPSLRQVRCEKRLKLMAILNLAASCKSSLSKLLIFDPPLQNMSDCHYRARFRSPFPPLCVSPLATALWVPMFHLINLISENTTQSPTISSQRSLNRSHRPTSASPSSGCSILII